MNKPTQSRAQIFATALFHAQNALIELELVDETINDLYPLSDFHQNSTLSRLIDNPLACTRELVEQLKGLSNA